MDVEQVNNIDRNLKLLGERIEVLEDILFDIRNINIQFSILLGLENQEIKQLLKVSEEEIECFRWKRAIGSFFKVQESIKFLMAES